MLITDPADDTKQIEVFTAEEVATKTAAVEATYKPQVTELTEKLTEAEKRSAERAGEFAQFRKLSEEQVSKLTIAEKTIYENGLALQAEREKNVASEKKTYEAAVDATIRSKVGNDSKLFEKAKDMYKVIGLEDITPEQMQARATAAVGALMQTEPDLLASIGVSVGGTYEPPKPKAQGEGSYADTEAGKAAAAALGLTIEPPKKA